MYSKKIVLQRNGTVILGPVKFFILYRKYRKCGQFLICRSNQQMCLWPLKSILFETNLYLLYLLDNQKVLRWGFSKKLAKSDHLTSMGMTSKSQRTQIRIRKIFLRFWGQVIRFRCFDSEHSQPHLLLVTDQNRVSNKVYSFLQAAQQHHGQAVLSLI